MIDLYNVIPNPLNKNGTINSFYSYKNITNYVNNNNKRSNNKILNSYFAISDFSGQETSDLLKKYNSRVTKNLPAMIYKINNKFYIPSIGELSMALERIDFINNILKEKDKKQIDTSKIYLSSTLYDINNVWNLDMNYAKISYSDIYNKYTILPFLRYTQNSTDIEYISNKNTNINSFLTFNNNIDNNNIDNLDINNSIYYLNNENKIYCIIENIFIGRLRLKNNRKNGLKFYIDLSDISFDINDYNINNVEINLYTFDNYLDIFKMNYKEIFILKRNDNNIFEFNNFGYFSNEYCIAITIEIKYNNNNNSSILFRHTYFYKAYDIILSFPFTNKIKIKYNENNYIQLNNYKFNNNILKNYLTDYLLTNKNSIINDNDSFSLLFNKNSKHITKTKTGNIIINENAEDYVSYRINTVDGYIYNNDQNIYVVIRSYFHSNFNDDTINTYGIYGKFYNNGDDINETISDFINLYDNEENLEYHDVINNKNEAECTFRFNRDGQDYQLFNQLFNEGFQYDILFTKESDDDTYKMISIINNTEEHVNIWIEDEYKRLCNNKTRLCIEPNTTFVTCASRFIDSYYIKIEIESYNKYTFDNGLPFSNICINNSIDLILQINKR